MGDKDKVVANPYYIPTQKGRLDALCNLAMFPAVVCFMAFTRPTLYRFFGIGGTFKDVLHGKEDVVVTTECAKFAWLNNSQFTVTCDNRSLDIHSVLAVMWLVIFTAQALAIKYNFRAFHKKFGAIGLPLAAVNVFGMMQFAAYDFFYPMPDTPRPAIFTPFMWFLSVEILTFVKESYTALKSHDVDAHALWMYRAFVKSFSTPVMRFYPMVLRYAFGTTCVNLNGGKLVFASMTLAAVFISTLSYVANLFCLKEPHDKFLKTTLIKSGVTVVIEIVLAAWQGSFVYGSYQCWKVGPENFDTSFAWTHSEL